MDKFTITDRGYDVVEVNKFVSDVIAQTESMLEKMKKQHDEHQMLKREIEHYKNLIGYDDLVKEVDEDMRRLGLRR